MKRHIYSVIKYLFFPFGLNVILASFLLCVWLSLRFNCDVFAYTVFLLIFTGVTISPLYFAHKSSMDRPWLYTMLTIILYAVFNCCVYLLLIKPQKTVELAYIFETIIFNASVIGIIIADVIWQGIKSLRKKKHRESLLIFLSDRSKTKAAQKIAPCIFLSAFVHISALSLILLDHLYNVDKSISSILVYISIWFAAPTFFYSLYFAYRHGAQNGWIPFVATTITHLVCITTWIVFTMATDVSNRERNMLLFYIIPLSVLIIIIDLIITLRKQKRSYTV